MATPETAASEAVQLTLPIEQAADSNLVQPSIVVEAPGTTSSESLADKILRLCNVDTQVSKSTAPTELPSAASEAAHPWIDREDREDPHSSLGGGIPRRR